MAKSRRVDLYRVSLYSNENDGGCVRSVVCNDYLLPGVVWAYRNDCRDGWAVFEEWIGKGRLNGYAVEDLIPPPEKQRPTRYDYNGYIGKV